MAFDYKKEYKEFYMPKNKPNIVEIPKMNYLAVRGKGNPNDKDSEYMNSIGLLYSIAFTIKMSYKGSHKIDGYFEYVVPPLEGFWWQDGIKGMDYNQKDKFNFISIIRLPDFVTKKEFDWAIQEATNKKGQDFSKVEYLTYDELEQEGYIKTVHGKGSFVAPKNTEMVKEQANKDIESHMKRIIEIAEKFSKKKDIIDAFNIMYEEDK